MLTGFLLLYVPMAVLVGINAWSDSGGSTFYRAHRLERLADALMVAALWWPLTAARHWQDIRKLWR